MANKTDECEAAILARMAQSLGALNREQAEQAVDLQIAEDAALADSEKKAKKAKTAE